MLNIGQDTENNYVDARNCRCSFTNNDMCSFDYSFAERTLSQEMYLGFTENGNHSGERFKRLGLYDSEKINGIIF